MRGPQGTVVNVRELQSMSERDKLSAEAKLELHTYIFKMTVPATLGASIITLLFSSFLGNTARLGDDDRKLLEKLNDKSVGMDTGAFRALVTEQVTIGRNAEDALLEIKRLRSDVKQMAADSGTIDKQSLVESAEFLFGEVDVNDTPRNTIEAMQSVLTSLNMKSNVEFRSLPDDGVDIWYRPFTGKQRPRRINDPTTSKEEIGWGYYYFWSQKGRTRTSDEQFEEIVGKTDAVVVKVTDQSDE